LGNRALWGNSSGSRNVAIGHQSMELNATGNENIAVGELALRSNVSGSGNVAIGNYSAVNNQTGYSNVAVGTRALNNNTNRSNLVAIGDSALFNNGPGAVAAYQAVFNTAVGSKALFTNTIGNNNTAIGFGADVSTGGLINATAIGSQAIATQNNSIQLGDANITTVNTFGNITVKNGKGLIRSSDGIQLKKLTAFATVSTTINAGSTAIINFSFPEGFTGLPDAYVGNITGGGGFAELVLSVANITISGGSLFVFNPRSFAASPNFSIKIIAIGPQ